MKPLTPYLFFNGNCREALNFYKDCFGGQLELMTYADAPNKEACPGVDPENGLSVGSGVTGPSSGDEATKVLVDRKWAS
jgi:uncharacterized glyoxalase superfamily protein PhnB